MNKTLICTLGYIGSGKDTVAKYIERKYHYKKDSFASTLKDVCSAVFGWPRHLLEGDTEESRVWREQPDLWWSEKLNRPNFSPRLALQLVGTEVFRDGFDKNIWLLSLENRFRSDLEQKGIIISDCRFANEIQLAKKLGGVLLYVDNGVYPEWRDTAIRACNGDAKALEAMGTQYKHIHRSEWEWANMTPDYIIRNDFKEKNANTMLLLEAEIDKVVKSIQG